MATVTFDHVTKAYADGTVAVDALDLEAPTGQITTMVGPSGCGKTTSLRMVNRMIAPTGGRIMLDDRDTASVPAAQLRRGIGYVIQNAGLFPHRTIADNVATVPQLLGWERGRVEARVVELLEPDRIGHGVKAAYDPRAMAMLSERGIVLEICPTSNLNTRVVSGWDEFRWIFDTFRRNDVRFTISTDGPEMLQTYIRDELKTLGRLGIMSVEEQEQVAAVSMAASFVPNVSDVPLSSRQPATRKVVERAKGILMTQLKCSEHEAFRWIQKTAMDRRLGMRQVAEAVITGLPGG